MIKGILFDKDGTVLEYEKFWVPVAEHAVKMLIGTYEYDEQLIRNILEAIGAYEGIRGILCWGTYGEIANAINTAIKNWNTHEENLLNGFVNEVTTEQTAQSFEECMIYGELVPACDNIIAVFKELKKLGLIVGMVTSDNQKLALSCLKQLGILEYFDVIYADDGVHPSKPDAYYMNCFCEQYSIKSSEVLMIGDTLTDYLFAENGGASFLGVAKAESSKELLLQKNSFVAEDISYVFEVLKGHMDEEI